jgi:hypothetical protein
MERHSIFMDRKTILISKVLVLSKLMDMYEKQNIQKSLLNIEGENKVVELTETHVKTY